MPTMTRKRPSLGELADQFESALSERSRLHSEVAALRFQIEQLQKQRKTLEEYDSERSRLDLEIMALRSQVEQLQKKNKKDFEEAIHQPDAPDSERSRLQSENTGLRAFIEQLQIKSKSEAEETTRQRKTLAEFESERSRLNSEIVSLRARIEELQKKSASGAEAGTMSSAKERLIKDELERKFQAAIVEARREQKRFAEQVVKMKTKLAKCICQSSSLD